MRIAVLLLLCLAVANAVPRSPQRIVGGSVTTIENYPYGVALLYSWNFITYSQACGGTVINNRSVLSAAHCFVGDTATRWRSRIGSTWASSGGTVYNTASIISHPNYSGSTYNNDVAILRTSANIVYGNSVAAASIAGSTYNLGDNQVVWAIGWGTTSSGGSLSEQLRHVQIWTVNQAVCRQRYGTNAITDQMLCSGWLDVGGRDQCQGDSGGPLIHNNVIVGVCSWGYGCAQAYYPGVNARVSALSTWIVNNA